MTFVKPGERWGWLWGRKIPAGEVPEGSAMACCFQCLIPEYPTAGWASPSSLQALGRGDGVNPTDVCVWKIPLGSPCTGTHQGRVTLWFNHRIVWI